MILKAYHRWGRDCVEHFHGMFAFAIAEHETGRVVLARDRLGIKPLYVSRTPARLRFASTLPAVVAGGGVDTTIDRVALHHYMTFHSVVPAPRTILRGVRKLPGSDREDRRARRHGDRPRVLGAVVHAPRAVDVPRRAGKRPCSRRCASR